MFDRKKIIRSIVRVSPAKGSWAMGVVVGGGEYIMTAAHCLPSKPNGHHPLDHFPIALASFDRKMRTFGAVRFVDPISDMALIGCPNVNDGYPEEWHEGFEMLTSSHEAAPVALHAPSILKGNWVHITGHIYTHEGKWLKGTSRIPRMYVDRISGFTLNLNAGQTVKGGTSGSPAFDERGRVMGVVSISDDLSHCSCASTWGALPRWAIPSISGKRLRLPCK